MASSMNGRAAAGGESRAPEGGQLETVEVEAPAKINLFLRILDRRPDGFHELETLFQAISLADRVSVALSAPDSSRGPGGRGRDNAAAMPGGPSVELTVDGPDLGPPKANLAYRAAARFVEAADIDRAVRIHLTKRIPPGAGLGGGSSDAAAVLRCLAELTGFDEPDALRRIAAELGSDVPFFLSDSPLALGRGRGEELTELPPLPEAHLVVALPNVHVATRDAYAEMAARREAESDGGGRGPRTEPDRVGLGLRSWDEVCALASNDFQELVSGRYAEVGASLEGLRAEGARLAMLSGSGGAAFGLFGSDRAADEAATALSRRLSWPFLPAVTRTAMPRPE